MFSILSSFLISSRSLRIGTQAVAAVLLLSCGGGYSAPSTPPPSSPSPPPPNTFYVGGTSGSGTYGDPTTALLTFTPATLTIAAGTTVTWAWKSSGHSLDSGPGCTVDNQFSSGGIQSVGFTMTHTFNTPGTYPFFCGVHCGSNMKGTITVQ